MLRKWVLPAFLILLLFAATGLKAQTLINNTVEVAPLSYYSANITAKEDNVKVNITIYVISGPAVDLLLLDTENFNLFKQQMSGSLSYNVSALIGVQSTKSFSKIVTLSKAGTYYIVIVNWDLSQTSSVKILVKGLEEEMGIGGILLLVGLGAVVVMGIFLLKRRK